MKRLGMPASDDTILRHLKRQVARLRAKTPVRVAGIDDWSWRKGRTYGTIIVDLERREVVDVLPDRSAEATGRMQRLFVAQDTGGAIRGPVRADLFFGYGPEAADHAGTLKGRGALWVLLPIVAADRQGKIS